MFLALAVVTLTACQGETEVQCLDRLTENLSSQQILDGVGVTLAMIMSNEDLNVCDYTVLGSSVIKK